MSVFFPTIHVKSVVEIDSALLHRHGVTAMIIDIDNTLTTHNNPAISSEIAGWIEEMKHLDIAMVLVSNNHATRVEPFAQKIGLDFVANGKKPLKSGYRRAQNLLGKPVGQIAMVGDQLFTDIFGGNRFGLCTILVEPIQAEGNLFFRLKRWVEKKVLKRYEEAKEKET